MKTHTAALAALFLLATPAIGGEPVKEISSINDNDEIVLTVTPCPLEENHGFINYSYVLRIGEPHPIAEGCWRDGNPGEFDIWFPAIKSHFQLKHSDFKPRTTL